MDGYLLRCEPAEIEIEPLHEAGGCMWLFFQAEDGIRDLTVTGVQTCALPILIFERVKEELRAGRTLGAAMEAGVARAWPAIRDSNTSTLITCGVLYFFGAPLIKGLDRKSVV